MTLLCACPDLTVEEAQYESFVVKITGLQAQADAAAAAAAGGRGAASGAGAGPGAGTTYDAIQRFGRARMADLGDMGTRPGSNDAAATSAAAADHEDAAAAGSGSDGDDEARAAARANLPNESNAVWPMLLWKGGVGFPGIAAQSAAKLLGPRIELLRLLLAICCEPLYVEPRPQDPVS